MRKQKLLRIKGVLLILSVTGPATAQAFNSPVHVAITKSALAYLRTPTALNISPAVERWTRGTGPDQAVMEELLVRATVDADYRPEVFLSTWFHKPFTGARSGPNSSVFTRMFHFLNATIKGTAWDYDGYAFRHGTQQGFDGYLGLPGIVTRGDLSPPLGGKNTLHPVHGIDPGVYKLGFKGTDENWKKMFLSKFWTTETIFPPADVPAQLAFDAMLRSERAVETQSESWTDRLPVADTILANVSLSRHYWRGEVAGLPRGFDLLGLTFHMAQDVSVPQHASGTADNCHQEVEDLADQLACATPHNMSPKAYDDGSFTGDAPGCQHLYDPEQVGQIIKSVPELDPAREFTIRSRIQAVAKLAARWHWGDPEDSVDFMGTRLPDGSSFSADRCSDLMKINEVRAQVKYQYNLAVAATAALFQRAASQYEAGHPQETASAFSIF